ncbi:MAG TPA: aldehyde dehydrogenase family protein [Candidatus Nanoarchaeia archaeon]|nr:aldehyde dehydrogenase family protein [Candidatus Nanoarchaeia archaeon]
MSLDVTEYIARNFSNETFSGYKDDKITLGEIIRQIDSIQRGVIYHSIIGGKIYPTTDTFQSLNPNNPSQVIGQFSNFGTNPVNLASLIETTDSAVNEYRKISVEQRASGLREIANVLRERRIPLVAAIVAEMGKTPFEADADIAEAIDFANYYALSAEVLLGNKLSLFGGQKAELDNNPLGTSLSIDPFNFFAIKVGQDVLALAGGNSVISKPSPHNSYCGLLAHEAEVEGFKRAGINIPGLINLMYGGKDEVHALLKSGKLGAFCYTGGREGGLQVMNSAQNFGADRIPGRGFYRAFPMAFETNGVNASIVLNDASIDDAVNASIAAMTGYSGQKCSARSWTIVQDGVYNEFKLKFLDSLSKVSVGPVIPDLSNDKLYNDMGALISEAALNKTLNQIKYFVSKGAKIIYGENPRIQHPSGGYFMKPVVLEIDLETLDANSELRNIEMFAPSKVLIRAKDFDEALRIEKMGEYALTGSLFTKDQETIARWRRESRVGNKYVNRKETGALVGQTFGGGGNSDSGLGGIKGAGGPHTVLRSVNQSSTVGYF